jgi:hypothetical protein
VSLRESISSAGNGGCGFGVSERGLEGGGDLNVSVAFPFPFGSCLCMIMKQCHKHKIY